MTLVQESDTAEVLEEFGGDPQKAESLAAFLGFDPISSPQDLLAGRLTGDLKHFFARQDDRFGVHQLYKVGARAASSATVGLYIAVLADWGHRSSDRDRPRRRIARALVEYTPDRRSLALLVPPAADGRREAELVFPRTQADASSGAVTSIRAHLDLDAPTRFHRDLLRGLRIPAEASLLEISRRWQQQFSIERVTTKFYQEYATVRDRMASAFLSRNQDHPVVREFDPDDPRDARAWATRQMGRVLFLWFLQAKRWLGKPGGQGSATYLLDLWKQHATAAGGEYYRDVLVPLFFDAMATGSSSRGEDPILGFVPYLNGGLFRRNALEDRVDDAGPISLPDEVFDPANDDALLGLLSRYRFTTRESTPDDQSVDPDPELLGRVFENLYQGDERHNTGTYYTPREIVHFMCREVLDGYLRDSTGVDQGTLDSLRGEAFGSRDESQPPAGVPVDDLVDALETVRICDPAVGSGAFLLGSIQEMVALRRGILFSQQPYVEPAKLYRFVSEWKRRIIENSLYGVDINPEAVEICHLRLWLSMVLDMDEPPGPQSGWALPNLDFQIVAGDSLVDRVAGITFKESWPPPRSLWLEMELQNRLQRLETNIARRKQEFEGTHRNPKRLRELRDRIARDQREIIRLHLEDALGKAEAERKALTKAALRKADGFVDRIRSLLEEMDGQDFALVQKPFLWPIAFPAVLREGDSNAGFDIVLANPPYVRMEKIDNEDEEAYGEAFPQVSAARADLLVYFYARALQILRPDGWLAFITSNKFMRAGYGAGIREHLPASLRMRHVIDFGDLPLFEANGKPVAAYPSVVVGSHSNDSRDHALNVADLTHPIRSKLSKDGQKVNPENVRSILEDLDGLLSRTATPNLPQVMLKKEGWILEDPALIRLFDRMMNQGTTLGEFVKGRIYYGVKTGLNDAFVIDQAKRDELIAEDPRSAEIIKPWLRGKDIKRWRAESPGLYVIFTNRGVEIDRYPAIQEHLRWFRSGLEKRATAHLHPWYELQQPQEGIYHEFAYPKIIFNRFIKSPTFAYDTSGSYCNNACYFAIPPSPSIAAIVNSKIEWFLLSHLCTMLQNGYLQVFVQFLEQIPIPQIPKEVDQCLAGHVDALASGIHTPRVESEIENITAEAFGLSVREVTLVEEWFERRTIGRENDDASPA